MVAVFALSAAPQSASAKVHRVFYAVDQDFYMQFAYDDVSGVFAINLGNLTPKKDCQHLTTVATKYNMHDNKNIYSRCSLTNKY